MWIRIQVVQFSGIRSSFSNKKSCCDTAGGYSIYCLNVGKSFAEEPGPGAAPHETNGIQNTGHRYPERMKQQEEKSSSEMNT